MQPGNLDQKIKIQTKTETADGYGGFITSWCDNAEVWAKIKIKAGSEVANAMQVEVKTSYEIIVRSNVNIDEKMRIVYGERTLNIKSSPPFIRGLYRIIEAEELNTDAE
jgi:SPP1 family predicted phage head-tail adaptor